ncbi:hypothetical protein EZ449_15840 [Pedobacter frigidisoli]|uniref:Activator of Hsp90 ATPase homologue 1/2-like C-terminal domain-containing protein n=1 Tax=Pedobacter frigidisoli TaxID=2530455 RepID=A0A4V2MME1_9SPHI|nr:hypothetical protein EZ449_15840 [Pedobacter frigidisoli]
MDTMENRIIDAVPRMVWRALTQPEIMKQWTGEQETEISVSTEWTTGNRISITGFHHIRFENSGKVLAFKTEENLSY